MPSELVLQWMWTIGGPFVAVCIALYLFYTDRIVTKSSYDKMVEAKNQTISDRDKIIEKQDKTIDEYIQLLKDNASITDKALDRVSEENVRRR